MNASNNQEIDIRDNILTYFENDIDCARLKTHLSILPNLIRTANCDTISVKRVTNLQTIADAMETN